MASETHVVLEGSHRPKAPDAVKVGELDPKERISVGVYLREKAILNYEEFDVLQGGHSITLEEYGERFGPRKEDIDKVAETLGKFGLKVEEVSLHECKMRVSGTVAAMEAAFKPGMVLMRSDRQGEFRGRQGKLQIPVELKGIVDGVLGFDQRRVARHR